VAGSLKAFQVDYRRTKGGTFAEWSSGEIKEGSRADYSALRWANKHWGTGPPADRKPLNHGRFIVGNVAGIPVGHEFFSRSEMAAVGFHRSPMRGIDYCPAGRSNKTFEGRKLPYALCVISSGGYEDDNDNGDWLWYTGEGGNDLNSSRRQVAGQLLKGGNEALHNSMTLRVPVRLARFAGKTQQHSYSGISYFYDGLYNIVEYKSENGTQGKKVLKFKLVRQKGQKPLRKNAVAPMHQRLLQLGGYDGSTEKRERKAEAEVAEEAEAKKPKRRKTGAAASGAKKATAAAPSTPKRRSRRLK